MEKIAALNTCEREVAQKEHLFLCSTGGYVSPTTPCKVDWRILAWDKETVIFADALASRTAGTFPIHIMEWDGGTNEDQLYMDEQVNCADHQMSPLNAARFSKQGVMVQYRHKPTGGQISPGTALFRMVDDLCRGHYMSGHVEEPEKRALEAWSADRQMIDSKYLLTAR